MGKKRKPQSGQREDKSSPTLDVENSRKRIRDFEDVADSDDEFHLNRDRILLDEEPSAKRRRRWQEQEEFLQASDEEVLGGSDVRESDDAFEGQHGIGQNDTASVSASSNDGGQNNEDEVEWGISRDDLYGADDIETEEQALEEEAEGLRLQKKQLQSMSANDYGFDEADWSKEHEHEAVSARDRDNVVTEILPPLQIREDAGPSERLKLLKSRYPEFEHLRKEYLNLQTLHPGLLQDAKNSTSPPNETSNAVIKLRAASAYLGSLAMYFALLASPVSDGRNDSTAMSASKLREHPVMNSLMKCRNIWSRARDLPADQKPAIHEAELPNVANGLGHERHTLQSQSPQYRAPKLSRAERHAEAARAAAEARSAERMQKTEAGLADLNSLVAPSSINGRSKSQRNTIASNAAVPDLGEEAPLTAREAVEKAQHKKSLRFYTSQIAQKANKRGTAGRNAGGDDDIPYRERLKDRQARLNAEAEKRGRRKVNAGDALGGESDENDENEAREIRNAGGDDYYDLVAARTAKKKSDKVAFAEAQRQAALQGGQVVQEESVGTDGKRKISYVIEKNKGLTPHRKKDVRNPRVKKRKKYDEKKKKLGSIKPVYKGGEGRGGYGGELTGIKKGLVKSTKL